jgi:hypothetical protein
MRFSILQNELQIDQILNFLNFQGNGDFEDILVLSNYAYYSPNISNFYCINSFEHNIDLVNSKHI